MLYIVRTLVLIAASIGYEMSKVSFLENKAKFPNSWAKMTIDVQIPFG